MNLALQTLRTEALTDRDAAWELSEAEIAHAMTRDGRRDTPERRRDFLRAYAQISGRIPAPKQVPLPVKLACDVVEYAGERPWTDAPTEEEAYLTQAVRS